MASMVEILARQVAEAVKANDAQKTVVLLGQLVTAVDEVAEPSEADDKYRAAAQEVWASDDCEIDDDAIVSEGCDAGAWVQAWVWVRNDQAGIEEDEGDA